MLERAGLISSLNHLSKYFFGVEYTADFVELLAEKIKDWELFRAEDIDFLTKRHTVEPMSFENLREVRAEQLRQSFSSIAGMNIPYSAPFSIGPFYFKISKNGVSSPLRGEIESLIGHGLQIESLSWLDNEGNKRTIFWNSGFVVSPCSFDRNSLPIRRDVDSCSNKKFREIYDRSNRVSMLPSMRRKIAKDSGIKSINLVDEIEVRGINIKAQAIRVVNSKNIHPRSLKIPDLGPEIDSILANNSSEESTDMSPTPPPGTVCECWLENHLIDAKYSDSSKPMISLEPLTPTSRLVFTKQQVFQNSEKWDSMIKFRIAERFSSYIHLIDGMNQKGFQFALGNSKFHLDTKQILKLDESALLIPFRKTMIKMRRGENLTNLWKAIKIEKLILTGCRVKGLRDDTATRLEILEELRHSHRQQGTSLQEEAAVKFLKDVKGKSDPNFKNIKREKNKMMHAACREKKRKNRSRRATKYLRWS